MKYKVRPNHSILRSFMKHRPLLVDKLVKVIKADNLGYAQSIVNRLNYLGRTMHETNIANGMPAKPFNATSLDKATQHFKSKGLL